MAVGRGDPVLDSEFDRGWDDALRPGVGFRDLALSDEGLGSQRFGVPHGHVALFID